MLYELLLRIPNGKVVSYKELGRVLNVHPRYVAKLLSLNKEFDKYPCYKVVCSDGSVGGYVLGVAEKVKRLRNDGVEFVDDRVKGKMFKF
ncbi:cysteine methyltransferase [archaeon]|nr:cysteine methyltransferase [archaeon]